MTGSGLGSDPGPLATNPACPVLDLVQRPACGDRPWRSRRQLPRPARGLRQLPRAGIDMVARSACCRGSLPTCSGPHLLAEAGAMDFMPGYGASPGVWRCRAPHTVASREPGVSNPGPPGIDPVPPRHGSGVWPRAGLSAGTCCLAAPLDGGGVRSRRRWRDRRSGGRLPLAGRGRPRARRCGARLAQGWRACSTAGRDVGSPSELVASGGACSGAWAASPCLVPPRLGTGLVVVLPPVRGCSGLLVGW